VDDAVVDARAAEHPVLVGAVAGDDAVGGAAGADEGAVGAGVAVVVAADAAGERGDNPEGERERGVRHRCGGGHQTTQPWVLAG
jgi:hypothetical protein